MNLKFSTTFTVMPKHTNYMFPMIFGGAFFSEIDLCAAQCVNRLLHDSTTARAAVTHKFTGSYHKPTFVGDLVFLEGEVVKLGYKSVVVQVKAFREKRGLPGRDFVAEAEFVFITVQDTNDVQNRPEFLPYVHHGLKMPTDSPVSSLSAEMPVEEVRGTTA